MKLVSFLKDGNECAGLISGDKVYDIDKLNAGFPGSMQEILMYWDENFNGLQKLSNEIENSSYFKSLGMALKEAELIAPVPHPPSLRATGMLSASMWKRPEETGAGDDTCF